MSVEGVDGCWAGPADMAASMGIDPRDAHNHQSHADALQEVLRACKAAGKIPGLAAPSPEAAASRAGEGFQFLTAGGDAGLMMAAAQAGLKVMGLA